MKLRFVSFAVLISSPRRLHPPPFVGGNPTDLFVPVLLGKGVTH